MACPFLFIVLVFLLIWLSTDRAPAIAMFGSFARYKREAYRHSTHAPRILHDDGLDVVMKVGLHDS